MKWKQKELQNKTVTLFNFLYTMTNPKMPEKGSQSYRILEKLATSSDPVSGYVFAYTFFDDGMRMSQPRTRICEMRKQGWDIMKCGKCKKTQFMTYELKQKHKDFFLKTL